ncbi:MULTISPECIES: A24 family peptidase [Vibrio]|uniref:A24 family peptidase n=1 Tax=Vibrio TaxID=662 RepID=UPI002075F6AD|nr:MULTISPECIES: A24 family peptidase [Vibrio]USD33059.1 prepilin peptidase [Vibrio sp. SCSIO 43186]USD46128.1 prepilin peptidase [Vibrio sp. SCSIO 43145]USD70183.1 prepilin peptidase [Vibrio sp. SCSIO 43139]USD95097.1 prepilin peptidase [Vibrio coralliilyticus]
MNLLIWIVLFAVAVSDAKEHRIPNSFLLVITGLAIIEKTFISQDLSLLFWSFITGITCFICTLLLYFFKLMSPGDVKLLGVVGFWLGSEHITQAIFWIAVSSVVVGVFYALLRIAESPEKAKALFNKYSLLAMYGESGSKVVGGSFKRKMSDHYRMPFAPVVVLGIAIYFYFLN